MHFQTAIAVAVNHLAIAKLRVTRLGMPVDAAKVCNCEFLSVLSMNAVSRVTAVQRRAFIHPDLSRGEGQVCKEKVTAVHFELEANAKV
jgi:hypothetical protein